MTTSRRGTDVERSFELSDAAPLLIWVGPELLEEEPTGRHRERRALVSIEGGAVAIGIDAAVVASHHVVVRRAVAGGPGETLEQFTVPPTLSGLSALTKRLGACPAALAVAEPTSMTWLPLAVALGDASGALALVGNRHSARLRSALAGKNKSDQVDAAVLSRAGELFSLETARAPDVKARTTAQNRRSSTS